MHHDHHGHHDHCHHHHHNFEPDCGKRFIIAIIINLLYVGAEFYCGFKYDSVGLLADAGHNLGDVGGLLISLIAFFLLKKAPSHIFTFGLKKATVLAAFVNSLLLLAAVVMIVVESVEKFLTESAASGWAIITAAGIGIVVNGITVILLNKGKNDDLNIKSAYLHMLADTLVSCGVAVSGALIMLTGFTLIDPIVGLVIAVIILLSSWKVFCESLVLILDGVPANIDCARLLEDLLKIDNVAGVHHLHIRAVSTAENSASMHIKLRDLNSLDDTRNKLKEILKHYGIAHSTIEFESAEYHCHEHGCGIN